MNRRNTVHYIAALGWMLLSGCLEIPDATSPEAFYATRDTMEMAFADADDSGHAADTEEPTDIEPSDDLLTADIASDTAAPIDVGPADLPDTSPPGCLQPYAWSETFDAPRGWNASGAILDYDDGAVYFDQDAGSSSLTLETAEFGAGLSVVVELTVVRLSPGAEFGLVLSPGGVAAPNSSRVALIRRSESDTQVRLGRSLAAPDGPQQSLPAELEQSSITLSVELFPEGMVVGIADGTIAASWPSGTIERIAVVAQGDLAITVNHIDVDGCVDEPDVIACEDTLNCDEVTAACFTQVCNPLLGCTTAPADDGTPCGAGEHCGEPTTCESGVCVTPDGTAHCDDGNPCTYDHCEDEGDCVHSPLNSGACSDGDPCTENGECVDGECDSEWIDCDDNNPCTVDSCGADGCAYAPDDGVECDDGDKCTENDQCSNGTCGGAAKSCPDDGPCKTGYCDNKGKCKKQNVDGPCDDGDACTVDDYCDKGTCKSGPEDCDDGNPCTSDGCVEFECSHSENSDPCDDGDECTESDQCQGGVCAGVPACDDDNPCTADSCSAN